jgi:ABC-2 type transport system permease protein
MVRILGLRTRAEAQYRASLVTLLVSQALVGAADLVALWGLFSRVDVLGGWRADEVLFFYAVSAVGFGVADTFISPVEYCDQYVRMGTFDQFMVRPAGCSARSAPTGSSFAGPARW